MRGRLGPRVAGAALALALAGGAGGAAALDLRLAGLNRVYEDVAGEIPPVRFDPATIRLSSPHQRILLKENRIHLERAADGRVAARVELDVLGKGDLVADVDLGGSTQRLTDELLLPRQTLVVEGLIRLSRGEGGYRVVTEELPAEVPVAIRSRLVGQVLGLCAGASLLTLGALDCEPLAERLENPKIPLPGPGFELLVPDADLSADDRLALDGFLAGR